MRAWGDAAAAFRTRRNFAWLTAGGDNHVLATSEGGVATLLVTNRTRWCSRGSTRPPGSDEELEGLPLDVIDSRGNVRRPWTARSGPESMAVSPMTPPSSPTCGRSGRR